MNISYVIYMTVCFLAFIHLKAFKYIEKYAKLKEYRILSQHEFYKKYFK